jgi:hypothetical protein
MITLKRNEEVELYQVELALKVKTKQSPFIAILILSEEQKKVSAATLQKTLLTSLTVRACFNLLRRLEQQGYLKSDGTPEITRDKIREILEMHDGDLEKAENYIEDLLNAKRNINAYFSLTELGKQSAADKSFWLGEKGVYNVYVSKSNLIRHEIIKTEKVERAEDNRGNRVGTTPLEIQQYENKTLTINDSEILIEDVEKRCFTLKPITCILEIQAKGSETTLKISNESQQLFQTDLEIEESVLQEELLAVCNEFQYDEEKRTILAEFSKDNLSFNRKVKIEKPVFQQNKFNQVELENISHIPSDKQNAELWLNELLYKSIERYFLDEKSFDDFASELAKPVLLHHKIKVPKRRALAKELAERSDAFYQVAKLETIDHLNYEQ